MPRSAATLRAPIRFEGVGLHTGEPSTVTIVPAQPNEGLVFKRGAARIPAIADYAVESPLATVLERDGVQISTIEHVLSALFVSGVSAAEIVVDGPEIPILDGSALPYVEAIEQVGLLEWSHDAPSFTLREAYELREGEKAVIVLPSEEFRVRFIGDYPPPIGTHYFDGVIAPQLYRDEIAGARTFAMLRDVEAMRAAGLARGGSLDNALVYAEDGPMQPLQWPNETVRHKVLDLIGDFALLGAWPRCEVIAIKSGHAMHARVTRELRKRG